MFMRYIIMVTIAAIGIVGSMFPAYAQEHSITAQDLDSHSWRIEQEDKIWVPLDKADEVWEYLYNKYVVDPQGAKNLDPLFTTYHYDEQFADTYFDTPDLKLLSMQSGVRHRRRVNLTNPDDPKSGREAMQVKLNNISDKALERGEIKFDIEYPRKLKHPDDNHAMLGIVQDNDRQEFKQVLTSLDLDPYSMQPVLTVHDFRRRIYFAHESFSEHGTAFLSISFDNASANMWWATTKFVEIEPELSEIEFTMADDKTKKYMEDILQEISDDLYQQFPYLERNLTPKYNKSFNFLEEKLPFFELLIKTRMNNVEGMLISLLVVFGVVFGGGYLGIQKIRQKKN